MLHTERRWNTWSCQSSRPQSHCGGVGFTWEIWYSCVIFNLHRKTSSNSLHHCSLIISEHWYYDCYCDCLFIWLKCSRHIRKRKKKYRVLKYHNRIYSVFCVYDLRNRRQAGNMCMLPECCAAHRGRAHPDDTQRNNEDNGTGQNTHTRTHIPRNSSVKRLWYNIILMWCFAVFKPRLPWW